MTELKKINGGKQMLKLLQATLKLLKTTLKNIWETKIKMKI